MTKWILDSADKTNLLNDIGDSGWSVTIETLPQATINNILNGVDNSKFINFLAFKVA